MESVLENIGVREAKNNFSSLTEKVNELGLPVTVTKNNKPWVVIYPADYESSKRNERLEAFRRLTRSIELVCEDESEWDASKSDKELLAEARAAKYE